ncbi:hypothetical protein [Bradyrhizobium sp. UFLA03-84]|uniref:hypothetical protein n=1 Tax=Bradyrhizobium sp. UFLA03-84 TaxID=418599 RepID=UPI000BAE5D79|nr:hypothetical protein [Bradyrhizobium sp. UFLA03-84]
MATTYQLWRPAVTTTSAAAGAQPATMVGTYATQALAQAASLAGDHILGPGYDWSLTSHRPKLTNQALVVVPPQFVTVGGGGGSSQNYQGHP